MYMYMYFIISVHLKAGIIRGMDLGGSSIFPMLENLTPSHAKRKWVVLFLKISYWKKKSRKYIIVYQFLMERSKNFKQIYICIHLQANFSQI